MRLPRDRQAWRADARGLGVNDPQPAAPLFVQSLDEVSAHLGTTERQWRTYAKRPGFPAKIEGKGYDLAALAAWKDENVAQRGDGKLAAKKLEKLELDIRLSALKVAQAERLTVARAAVDALHGLLAQRLKAYLYSKLENEMPPKIAGCDALTIRKYGRALADEIVTTLQRDINSWGEQNN
jgi:hypothetical protein